MDYDGEFPAVGLYNVCNDYHSYETTFKIGFKYVQLEVTKAMVCVCLGKLCREKFLQRVSSFVMLEQDSETRIRNFFLPWCAVVIRFGPSKH